MANRWGNNGNNGLRLIPFELIFMYIVSYSYGLTLLHMTGFPYGSAGEESACNAGDLGLIPGLGRSPGEGKGYPLQYSGLEKSMDSSPWGCKELSDFHFRFDPIVTSLLKRQIYLTEFSWHSFQIPVDYKLVICF